MKRLLVGIIAAGSALAGTETPARGAAPASPAPRAAAHRVEKAGRQLRPVRWLKRIRDREADLGMRLSGWGIRDSGAEK